MKSPFSALASRAISLRTRLHHHELEQDTLRYGDRRHGLRIASFLDDDSRSRWFPECASFSDQGRTRPPFVHWPQRFHGLTAIPNVVDYGHSAMRRCVYVNTVSRTILLILVVVFSTASSVGAETTVYFRGYALEVPSPLVLLGSGLALLGVAGMIRRWRS
jgi:uncharacterized integral membrane protein